MEKYIGKFVKIYAQKPDGWMSGLFETKEKERFNVSGILNNPALKLTYQIMGEKKIHPKYGEGIIIKSAVVMEDDSLQYIRNFLLSGLIKGIGPAMSEKIINAFGKDTLNIIDKAPEKLLDIHGISEKKRDAIANSYQKNKLYQKIYEITNGGITPNQANKIIEHYKGKSVEVLKNNPYELIYSIDGIGFIKADTIAKSMSIADDSIFRIQAAAVYVLKQMADSCGHCFLDMQTLQNEVLNLLLPIPFSLDTKKEDNRLKKCLIKSLEDAPDLSSFHLSCKQESACFEWRKKAEQFVSIMADAIIDETDAGRIIIDDDRIYLKKIYNAEISAAATISYMIKAPLIKTLKTEYILEQLTQFEKDNYPLDPLQKEAVVLALQNRLSVISGGPGCGKTTVIHQLVRIWGKDDVTLCAPTGRAAKRMEETTGVRAVTCNIALMEEVSDKLIIVDECSMLDILLAEKILELAENNHVVFVGDVAQLPPIGPGMFFYDLIQSPYIPSVFLKKCFRNAGSIAYNCKCINSGLSLSHFALDVNFKFIPTDREELLKKTVNMYLTLRENYGEKNVWILSPMKVRELGIDRMNEEIRKIVNPYDGNTFSINGFHEGDRIMIIKNSYHVPVYNNGEKEFGVFNGDCGVLMGINDEEGNFMVELDDGRTAVIDNIDSDIIQLSYASTIHKSQGSECDYIILPFDYAYYVMLKRNLLYTAVSRAKKGVIILGDKNAVNMAVRTVPDEIRNSFLKNRIKAE